MKIESHQSGDEKRKWKIVRLDSFSDIEGDVVTADEETGECCVSVNGETKTLSLGAGGIRLVARRR